MLCEFSTRKLLTRFTIPGLRSKQKTVGHLKSHAIILSVASWLTGVYHSMMDLQVAKAVDDCSQAKAMMDIHIGKAVDDCSRAAACTAPLTLWTLISREEASSLAPAASFLCPVSKVCNIYSNRVLPSNPGKEPSFSILPFLFLQHVLSFAEREIDGSQMSFQLSLVVGT